MIISGKDKEKTYGDSDYHGCGCVDMIVDERIITFINSMDTENSEILEQIEQEALAVQIPYRSSGRRCRASSGGSPLMKKPCAFLEVGTAVGFSALLMSDYCRKVDRITTIENYEKRFPLPGKISGEQERQTGSL